MTMRTCSKCGFDYDDEHDLECANCGMKISKIEEIKLQDELEDEINKHDISYYQFSVFISHSTQDYEDIHQLLLEMISNKIKPEVWFEEIDEEVRDKLCKKIDRSNLFLIYLTETIIESQMTNNEIGFVEGKRYYNKIRGREPNIVIRIYKPSFDINELSGFYTKAKDLIPFNKNNSKDIEKIINILKKKFEEINPNLSDFDENEIKILETIIKNISNRDSYNTLITIDELDSELTNISKDIISDTLELFHSNDILNKKSGGYFSLTSWGFFIYAPIFLKIDTNEDFEKIKKYISSYPVNEGVHNTKLSKDTEIPPLRLSFAVEKLVNENYLRVERTTPTHPFSFTSVYSTPRSRKLSRNE